MYKINPDMSYGGIVTSHSDVNVDITQYSPPRGYTFVAPVDQSYAWNGEAWIYPPAPHVPTLEELKEAKKAEISSARYNAEIAGILINGMTVKTDRESQSLITGAALKAIQDSTYSCRWKTEQEFITLTSSEIIAVADAVREHVQECFNREAELVSSVNACVTQGELASIEW